MRHERTWSSPIILRTYFSLEENLKSLLPPVPKGTGFKRVVVRPNDTIRKGEAVVSSRLTIIPLFYHRCFVILDSHDTDIYPSFVPRPMNVTGHARKKRHLF